MAIKRKATRPGLLKTAPVRRRDASRSNASWKRKNMLMDQRKLDRARAILGVPSETEAVDMALDLIAFRGEVMAGIDRLVAAGGIEASEAD